MTEPELQAEVIEMCERAYLNATHGQMPEAFRRNSRVKAVLRAANYSELVRRAEKAEAEVARLTGELAEANSIGPTVRIHTEAARLTALKEAEAKVRAIPIRGGWFCADAIAALAGEIAASPRDSVIYAAVSRARDPEGYDEAVAQMVKDIRADGRFERIEDCTTPRAMSPVDAFDMGFSWARMLIGPTLEDSRAIGRTLCSDLFHGLKLNLDAVPSFETADAGIVAAKAEIKRAIMASAPPAPDPREERIARLEAALTDIANQPSDHLSIQETDLRLRYARSRARTALGGAT